MIGGRSKTEATYRAVNLDSSSSLKDFSLDRKKYFRKYLMGENVEDKDSQAALMGRVVDCLLLEPQEFDHKFYMSACATAPTNMMLDFVNALYEGTIEATNEQGMVTRSFEDISRDAYVKSGYKISYERVINNFIGTDAEIFFNEKLTVRMNNLSVVTTQDVSNAERIVEELKTNPVTKDIVNLVDSVNYTVKNQLQVEGYSVDGHLFKSMIDKVIFNHKTKTVEIFDLKCVWSVENFLEDYFLYRRSYIQAFLYYKAVKQYAMDNGMEDYFIFPPKFIVCDSTNYYNPLIYTLDETDLREAFLGFEYKGRNYPGVKTLIEDLKWALTENIWNISRNNSINNGIVKLRG